MEPDVMWDKGMLFFKTHGGKIHTRRPDNRHDVLSQRPILQFQDRATRVCWSFTYALWCLTHVHDDMRDVNAFVTLSLTQRLHDSEHVH